MCEKRSAIGFLHVRNSTADIEDAEADLSWTNIFLWHFIDGIRRTRLTHFDSVYDFFGLTLLQKLCPGEWRPSRLEAECVQGDGLMMTFPRHECSPLADWRTGTSIVDCVRDLCTIELCIGELNRDELSTRIQRLQYAHCRRRVRYFVQDNDED